MRTVTRGSICARIASGRRAGFVAVIGLTASALLAACGGSASAPSAATVAPPTVAPTFAPVTLAPTVAPTVTATATPEPATPEPTADASTVPGSPDPAANGGFAFPAGDVFAYYKGLGYECQTPTASTQAAGYMTQRCLLKDDASGVILIVALVTDAGGATGDAFAGVLDLKGKTMPSAEAARTPLLGFLGAMLGQSSGTEAGTWVVPHLGETQAQTHIGDILVGTYTENDSAGVGIYVEVANKAFLDAPAP